MNKQEFLAKLSRRLAGQPQGEIEERLTFYSEIIDDRMEEGLTEEEAVAELSDVKEGLTEEEADGNAEDAQTEAVCEPVSDRSRGGAWKKVLLILGSPLWLVLLVTAFALVAVVYVVLWVLVVCLWACFAAFVAAALSVLTYGGAALMTNGPASGLLTLGAALFLGGLSIFLFIGCKAATKGAARLSRAIGTGIKRCFRRREKKG